MGFPGFFADIPPLILRDPLAAFLGAADEGLIEYRYADAVRLAGHSCPTVAAAWLMATRAMTALWPGEIPVRGGVRVDFRNARDSGVTGVVANVITLISGAADGSGFKGLAGRFDRRLAADLQPISGEVRFTRVDSGVAVDVSADLSAIRPDAATAPLMERCLACRASPDEALRFRYLWQERVQRILASPDCVRVEPVAGR